MAKRGKRRKKISVLRRRRILTAYLMRFLAVAAFVGVIILGFRLVGGIFRKAPEKQVVTSEKPVAGDWSMSDMAAGEGRRKAGTGESAASGDGSAEEAGESGAAGEGRRKSGAGENGAAGDGSAGNAEESGTPDDGSAEDASETAEDSGEGSGRVLSERLGVDIRGRVTATITEPFDEEVYDMGELEEMIRGQIAEYDKLTGNDKSVELLKLKNKKGVVNTQLRYATDADYRSFNDIGFYLGDVVALTFAGVEYDKELYSTDEKKESVKAGSTKRLSEEKLTTLAVSESMEIEVPGKIIYYSPDVLITGRNSAQVYNEEGYSFVVYKPGLLAGIFTK